MLDPADSDFARDPYPFYAGLRASGDASRVSLSNGSHAWLVTGYEQARTVLADARFSNVPPRRAGRPKPDSPAERARAALARHMLNADAPEHTRLRKLTTAAFSPRRVDALRPRIELLVKELLRDVGERAADGGPVDLVDTFAFPLPVLVIGEVLGVPEKDRSALREWTYRVGSPADALPPGALEDAWSSLRGYFTELIADKRATPADDLFSSLVHEPGEDGSPPDWQPEELLAMAFLLLFAGYETTMNLLASATLLLLQHPEELSAAQADQAAQAGQADRAGGRWDAVIEETLRHASPLEGTTWRRTTEAVTLPDGTVIPAESSVLVVLAAASRDPQRYPDPDAFRPARYLPDRDGRAAPHLAFGHGPHYCLGARLARLEARIALPSLFEALPGLRLAAAPEELPYRPGLLVRGPRTLPVTLEEATAPQRPRR
ncbi:cytochrome P450 [Streptomyces durbertensis]|uniref:Cytochrome P450 n=1 Tax=Streptomyces durbertensis TaxID=2448886 RepID=A0ABR6ECV1_9ACTN|nr:cytochrome P450 [Streptomyces durbertensis]MBB1243159.1 cytochrome P450 [Streptomyces durbertensis]